MPCPSVGRKMRRREFFRLIGGAAAWPFATCAQAAMPLIGFMHTLSPDDERIARLLATFHHGLNGEGYVEGKNVAVEYRWARGHYDLLPEFAADLISRKVAILVAAGGEPSPQVAKAATATIPIVFTMNGDPVRAGLVHSLSLPGGNATGVTTFGPAAVTKRLDLLHQLVPRAAIVGLLVNPNNPNADIEARAAEAAANALNLRIVVFHAGTEREIAAAFTDMTQQQVGALLCGSDPFFSGRRPLIVGLAAEHRLPAIYYLREFVEDGGFASYGNSLQDVYRLAGIYVGRILKGEKPADLPVQQSVKFEFLINQKTAKALGIDVPNSLQLLADEVVE